VEPPHLPYKPRPARFFSKNKGKETMMNIFYLITGVWTLIQIDTLSHYPSLALDAYNRPHIAYQFSTDNNDYLKYAWWDGTNWHTYTVDSGVGTGRYTSIAVDQNGYPFISYNSGMGAGNLRVAQWTGSSWIIRTADPSSYTGWFTSIDLDTSGFPRVAYHDYMNDNLKYARWNGSSWINETVDSPEWVGWFASLAIDDSNRPHISYHRYYYGVDGDLKYAHWNGSTWVINTVDAPGEKGAYSSIEVGRDFNIHIGYYDGDAGALKYAHKNISDAQWNLQTVRSPSGQHLSEVCGTHLSLALQGDTLPCILYLRVWSDDPDGILWVTEYWLARYTGGGWNHELITAINDMAVINYYGYTTTRSLRISSDNRARAVFSLPDHRLMYAFEEGSSAEETGGSDPSGVRCTFISGGIIFSAHQTQAITVYSSDGRVVFSGNLNKGQNRINLGPGVYLWQAGPYKGKAVVR
jgi:hypothetical protein